MSQNHFSSLTTVVECRASTCTTGAGRVVIPGQHQQQPPAKDKAILIFDLWCFWGFYYRTSCPSVSKHRSSSFMELSDAVCASYFSVCVGRSGALAARRVSSSSGGEEGDCSTRNGEDMWQSKKKKTLTAPLPPFLILHPLSVSVKWDLSSPPCLQLQLSADTVKRTAFCRHPGKKKCCHFLFTK